MKTYSYRVAALEKQRGQVYALINGQCTTSLQDKMKAEVEWTQVNNDKDPLELYKLIGKLVLMQTNDQYPFATMWEQTSVSSTLYNQVMLPITSGLNSCRPW